MQDREGESHGSRPLAVFERRGPVEFFPDVLGDVPVQPGLVVRQPVRDGVGDPLGEERRSVHFEDALLDHPAHEVRDVDLVGAVPETPLETVAVEQREEELEVFLLAVVRRRGHEQEVPRDSGEKLSEPVSLRVFHLAAEEGGRELVRFVADDEVVPAIGRTELPPDVLVAGEFVEPGDGEVVFDEPVARMGRFEFVVGQDFERKVEPPVKFVLPLLREAAGTDDEAAPEVGPGDQLLDEEPRHDGLSRAGVVREQEPERLPGQHGFVDGGYLVRQRVDERCVHRKERVEEVREPDSVRLGHEPEERSVAVEGPRPPRRDDVEARFVVPEDDLFLRPARWPPIQERERVRACHFALTTVTGASGRMPRITDSGWSSSSLTRATFPSGACCARIAGASGAAFGAGIALCVFHEMFVWTLPSAEYPTLLHTIIMNRG